ncbi:MAG: hypothetical protein ACLFQ1_11735 [Halochromatium sp.]|uniref:hypothetical protein n=1 Tax=Halochromatium sp. TaxID=2049430 RepID=UPI003084FFB9
MSLDAQQRPPRARPEVSQVVNARLAALGFRFYGELYECAECGPRSLLALRFDLVSGDWSMGCRRCEQDGGHDYADPINAILLWNAAQIEHAEKVGEVAISVE